jgi:nucleotide-binding universal stress UspA family protein
MESHRPIDDRHDAPDTARRILVAVHGREPARWELEVGRALMPWPQATVRVLAITDVPSPPSAALLPAARRARARARAEWRRLDEASVTERLEALLACLPGVPDLAWVHVTDADPGRAIVERAVVWGADLIVVGVDRASWLERRLLGPIHERVVAQAACGVLVMPPVERSAAGVRRGASASGRGGNLTVAARGGA